MPRHPTHPPSILPLALLALLLLAPAHAMALRQGHTILSAAERHEATPGLFSKVWSFLSALWSENGSALEPDGADASPPPASGADPDAATGDNGSALEPDGR